MTTFRTEQCYFCDSSNLECPDTDIVKDRLILQLICHDCGALIDEAYEFVSVTFERNEDVIKKNPKIEELEKRLKWYASKYPAPYDDEL